ncbi:branched-chain amino acid ABC transporter permease, partial [Chachezhania sediminis]|uniref:branched-chain amino acid ABC transporter permease n=1 Tax=Chachezhania sediminis TaxID=2599291 RepID=UPI00131C245A
TIALGFILRFAVGTIWGYEPQVLQSPLNSGEIDIGSAAVGAIGVIDLAIIGSTLLLTGIFYLFFRFTRLGLAMQGSSQNALAAYYMGIPVKTIQSLIWGAAGMTAAVAGILYASKGSIDPSIGFLGIKAFAAAVIGGMGSLPGAILGGLLIGGLEPLAGRYVAAGYSQIVPYLMMFLVLVLRPDGLLSTTMAKKV